VLSRNTKHWPIVSARVHPDDMKKLRDKHSDGKDVSRVIRALINMYINGKIPNVEAVFVDKI